MDGRDILNYLDKSSLFIISKQAGNDIFREIDGFVVKPGFVSLEVESEGKLESIPFAGTTEGIYQIKDRTGSIWYENKKVLDSYLDKFSTMTPLEMETLRNQGEFFPK